LCDFALAPGGLAKTEVAPGFAFSAAVFFGFFASRFDRICPLAMIVPLCLPRYSVNV
jgi:hypothetical protein